MKPKISILVPVYNENPEILNISFQSLLKQTLHDFECLVVDDSTESSTINACRAICESDSRFIYIKPPLRIGLAASLNLALRKASGEFLARFDSDDICLPDRLMCQFNYLKKHPDIDILGCGIKIIDEKGDCLGSKNYPLSHESIEFKFIYANAIAHPAVMAKRSVILSIGGYDPNFKFAEDLELWLRLLNAGAKFHNLADKLILYRQSKTSRSKNNWYFNVKARCKNLSFKYLVLKILAIMGIFFWSFLPKFLQELIYKSLMLKVA
jgi:glycosyltransferase involved in cell wall biosynthesis